jgi:Aldehyde dehydrogenase family
MRSQDAATVGGRSVSTAHVSESHADRRLLIDGRLVTADRVFPSVNPASGEVVGHAFAADCPFGGFKQSGVGWETGVAGLEEFLERKNFAAPVSGVAR